MHREYVVLPNVKLRSAGEIPANLVYNSTILDTDNCYTIPSVLDQTLNLSMKVKSFNELRPFVQLMLRSFIELIVPVS